MTNKVQLMTVTFGLSPERAGSTGARPRNHWVIKHPPSPTLNTKSQAGRQWVLFLQYDPARNQIDNLPVLGQILCHYATELVCTIVGLET